MKESIDILSEVWVDIIGYENYYKISNTGKVIKLESQKRLVNGSYMVIPEKLLLINSKKNYPCVSLNKNGKIRTYSMHRLLALHFIPNEDLVNKKEVKHKNKNIFVILFQI